MATKEAYSIAKRVIEGYFSALRKYPGQMSEWYTQDARLDIIRSGKSVRLVGRHSIHQFLKTRQEMCFTPVNYDCHSVPTPSGLMLAVLLIFGHAREISNPENERKFTMTMHLQYEELVTAIAYQTISFD